MLYVAYINLDRALWGNMTLASAATNPSDNLQPSWNLLWSERHNNTHQTNTHQTNRQRNIHTKGQEWQNTSVSVCDSHPHCAELPQNHPSPWEQAIWRCHTWPLTKLSVETESSLIITADGFETTWRWENTFSFTGGLDSCSSNCELQRISL